MTVLRNSLIAASIAALCAGVAVGAQSAPDPQQEPTQTPPPSTEAQQPSTHAEGTSVTLTGCVYKEEDVPGRTPNVAEQAGVLEDYILADAQPKDSSAAGTAGATGTSGMAGKMYKLEQVADERLSALVGKRVEVTGRIDAEAGDRPTGTTGERPEAGAPPEAGQPDEDRSVGPDQIELPEFEVMTIREIEGTCPPRPSSPRQ